jgi:hypothetical protein
MVPDPPGAVARTVKMDSRTPVPGSYAVKIRYGPYRVINLGQKNGMGESGMLSNYPHTNMDK